MSDANEDTSVAAERANGDNLRSKHSSLVVALVIAVLLVAGGGTATVLILNHRADVAAAERLAAAEREAEAAAAEAERQEREAAQLARRQQVYDSCVKELKPFLNALNVVDARLDVGLSQQEYSNLLGAASVAYSRIEVSELGNGVCLRAGAKLEDAFNSYNKVATPWNDCIFDYDCDVDDLNPMMQKNWAAAANSIAKAEQQIDKLDPANSSLGSANRST